MTSAPRHGAENQVSIDLTRTETESALGTMRSLLRIHQEQASLEANALDTKKGNSRSCNKTKDQAPEDKSFGPCIIICTDRHEDPFIVIKNRVYNDTLALANEDATALATLLGTVSMQHDTYLPWWRQNNASSIKQPSRSKTTASDDNASDISEIPRDNDYPKNICGSSYFQLGRKYHGPHVEDFSTQVAALIAQGKQALKNLRIQDGECAFECATKGKLTPEHFCQAGRMAWDEGESKLALQLFYFQETLKAKLRQPVTVSLTSVNPISVCALPVDAITAIKHRLAYCEAVRNLFPFAVDLLQVYTACPHCKQQSEHLNNTVMAFFTEQGLTPKLNGKEPDLVEVILPPPGPHHILAKLCYSMVVNQNWTCVFS